ncbi:hypothetical protein EMIT0111MI5_280027 [Burkholderia sp. IT-111MI5]
MQGQLTGHTDGRQMLELGHTLTRETNFEIVSELGFNLVCRCHSYPGLFI